LNLNGEWEFAETDDSSAQYLDNKPYPDKIIVPFCRESKLSGLGRRGFIKNVWYRRSFELGKNWKSLRTRLHVGACDWETTVWLNGKIVGSHRGGSAPVILEITDYLQPGKNTVVIHAFDDTRSGTQETGKQSQAEESFGCLYTRVTGLWQTVWLEGMGASYIKDFKIECHPETSGVVIRPDIDVPGSGLKIKAVAYAGNRVVGTAQVPVDWRNTQLDLKLSEKHLWSVDNPYLYSLRLLVLDGEKVVDELHSYFGLRTVSINGAAILINNKAVFQRLILDQGYYPDGVWTAPSDQALKHDIELSQAIGYNGARLHQKVFEPRFLYWADRLGYLVWGESPNWGLDAGNPLSHLPFINEWAEIIRRDANHPAIVGWCPFNETPANAVPLQNTVVNLTRMLDPSRPVLDTSGWTHGIANPEVLDMHDYDQNTISFRNNWNDSSSINASLPTRYGGGGAAKKIPFFISEFGGTGWSKNSGWGYGAAPKNIEEFYTRYKGLADALLDSRYLFGFCYTQLYDVEQEQNGLYTYQRQPKFDVKRMHDIIARKAEYEKNPPTDTKDRLCKWQVLVGAVQDKDMAKEWRYRFNTPPSDWMSPGFDDSNWAHGYAGFGQKAGSEAFIKTSWTSKDIWLRQDFEYTGTSFEKIVLVTHFDNGCRIYINGQLVWQHDGWVDKYTGFDITKKGLKAIIRGRNTIAIHCMQESGGQFIDAALLIGNAQN